MSVAVTMAASPFKGLVPYGDSDLDGLFFFGREREVQVICANLLASRLTVLYGPTGVGKSSVLRAGVVRSLRATPFRRQVVVFEDWADDPVPRLVQAIAEAAEVAPRASLAETLADAGAALDGELYVILDQLEEYFVYRGGDLAPGSFTAELADALTRGGVQANVLLCLREDALAKLDVLKTRVPGLFSNYLRLDHLDRESARHAIVGPVERWNELFGADRPVVIEPALVETVLDQVETRTAIGEGRRAETPRSQSATIEAPYLQLVLERLWEVERRKGSNVLRVATLTDLGGATRIVGDHLARAMRQLSPEEQETAAALFHQMVTPSGAKIAHSIPDLARYASMPETAVRAVVERLAAERILRPTASRPDREPRVEIFHDVLGAAILDWGTRFEAQREESLARRAAERRHRRATVVAAASLAGLIVVTLVAVFALTQRSQARDRARAARANELAARALLLQSTAPGAALADALAASRLESNPQIEAVLRSSLMASRLRLALHVGAPVEALTWIGNGRVAVGSADGRVRVWNTTRDRVELVLRAGGPIDALARTPGGDRLLVVAGGAATMWSIEGRRVVFAVRGDGRIADAALTEDGRLLATAGPDGVTIHRASDGAPLVRLRSPRARRVVFAPDGRTVVVARTDAAGHVTPWTYDVRSGRLLAALPQRGFRDAAFAPDSRVLATASANGTVALWRPRTGAEVRVLDDGGTAIQGIAFNPQGTMLATASSDGGVRVWRIADGSRFFFFLGHGAGVGSVTFSPDGAYLASMGEDGTARIWIVDGIEAGKLAAVLAGADGSVTVGAFSPGGHSLVTGGEDGIARLWEPRVEQRLSAVGNDGGPTAAARFLPGGGIVTVGQGLVRTRIGGEVQKLSLTSRVFALSSVGTVAAASGSSISIRALPAGTKVGELRAPAAVTALAFRADGSRLVAAAGRDVLVWSTSDRRLLHRFRAEAGIVRVALSGRGDLVATGDRSGLARLWSSQGRILHVLGHHHASVTDVRFDGAGSRIVTASEGTTDNAAIWDVGTGRLLFNLVGHFGTVTAASFSPDGRWILTAGPISAAVWDAETGQLLFYLRGASDRLTDAEWGPVGYLVVTAERDGILREYRCVVCRPIGDLRTLAEQRLAAR